MKKLLFTLVTLLFTFIAAKAQLYEDAKTACKGYKATWTISADLGLEIKITGWPTITSISWSSRMKMQQMISMRHTFTSKKAVDVTRMM